MCAHVGYRVSMPASSQPAPLGPLPRPRVTPAWAAELEYWAALRGLPPDPWPAPAAAVAWLRDITDAVALVAARLIGLPDDEAAS